MSQRLGVVLVLVATAIMVALGVMSFHEGTATSRPIVVPFDLFWCEKDDDCVAVNRIGCCSCKQGGGQAAITSWHRDDLRRLLKGACRRAQVCVQVNVCRYDVQPKCVDRHCTLAPRSPDGTAGGNAQTGGVETVEPAAEQSGSGEAEDE